MKRLEDILRPEDVRPAWPREVAALGLLAAVLAALLPALRIDASMLLGALTGQADAWEGLKDAFSRWTTDLTAWCLLPALAMLVAWRQGAIDLSVWSQAGLGGLVAAWTLQLGWPVPVAFAAAVAGGLAVGAVNALLVRYARLPAPVATAAVGLLVVAGVGWRVGEARSVPVPQGAFEGWHLTRRVAVAETTGAAPADGQTPSEATHAMDLPLRITRMLLVGVVFGVTVLALLARAAQQAGHRLPSPNRRLVVVLCASGALSALGGASWLLDHPTAAPVPTRLVGDLRIPAAALLAGVGLLSMRRSALCAMCLPGALMAATAWRQQVWLWPVGPYAASLAVLAAMVAGTHLAMARALRGRGRPALTWSAVAAAAGGLLAVAACVYADTIEVEDRIRWVGLIVWGLGMLLLATSALPFPAPRRKPLGEAVPGEAGGDRSL